MKLIKIKKIKGMSIECSGCHKKAINSIDGVPYCAGCGDPVLLMNAKLCINAVEHATVKLSVIPKSKILKIEKKDRIQSEKISKKE
jgi:hypothetical protein